MEKDALTPEEDIPPLGEVFSLEEMKSAPQETLWKYPTGVRTSQARAEYLANAVKAALVASNTNPEVTVYSMSKRDAVQMIEAFNKVGIEVKQPAVQPVESIRGVGINVNKD